MKKIGIDARLLNQTGVGIYLKNLLYYLEKILPDDILLYVYLLPADFESLNFSRSNIKKQVADYHWHSFNEQWGFLKQLLKDKLDLMHFTYFSSPFFYPGKFIATIHDLTPWYFKTGKASTHNQLIYEIKYWFYKLIITRQVKKAVRIITPTYAVRDNLLRIFGKRLSPKIEVTHEGVNYQLKEIEANQNLNQKIKEKYFLYVGNFYPHKNVEFLIKTFSQLKNQHLVLAGPANYFSQRLLRLIENLKTKEQFIFVAQPSLANLKYLYTHSLALLHPSLSEGFGLPIIEAMFFNKPIVASKTPPFNELTNHRHFSFDPHSEKELLAQINLFLKNKITTVDYGDFEKNFSFEKMAKSTLGIYQHCLS